MAPKVINGSGGVRQGVTSLQANKFFLKNNKIKCIDLELIDNAPKNKLKFSRPFFSLNEKIVGENHKKKIIKIQQF